MIQLIAVAGTFNAVASLVIAARLYFKYRKSPTAAHAHFLLFYIYFGIFYILFATTQLFLNSQESAIEVGIFHIISYFFLFLSIGYILSVPYIVEKKESTAQRILILVLIFNVLFMIARVINFEASVLETINNQYLYWRPLFPEWMRILAGIFSIATTIFVSIFFFRQGRKGQEPFVRKRSFLLGSGFSLLLVAAMLSFIAAPTGSFLFVAVGTFLVLAALLVILRGIYYSSE